LLGEFRTQGTQLVAVSPQLPDNSLDTQTRNNLQFSVLSDVGLHAARSFGIVFKLTPELLELYDSFGRALADFNGEAGQTELPIPATFVISPDRHVTFAHVNADYTRRAEPLDVLQHIKQLRLAAA
jgi:peroxiredoxin